MYLPSLSRFAGEGVKGAKNVVEGDRKSWAKITIMTERTHEVAIAIRQSMYSLVCGLNHWALYTKTTLNYLFSASKKKRPIFSGLPAERTVRGAH
jgi:hypothetical protein